MSNTFIITTAASEYLARQIAEELGVPLLPIERRYFSNGECYYRIDVQERYALMGKNVIYVGSTHNDPDFLELLRVGGTLANYGTRKRIFIIPYLGYSTMERATIPGEIVTAKENVRLLSSIPSYGLGNSFLFLDLHAHELIHYFEGDDLHYELHAEPALIQALRELKLDNFVFASTDLGRPLAIESLAKTFDTDIALISKARHFEETEVLAVIGEVENRTVVIYDDMIRSAESLIKAAVAYKEKGAEKVYALVSHLALNNDAVIAKLEQSVIEKIITTNSHPMSQHPAVVQSDKFIIKDVSPIFCQAVERLLT